MERLHGRKGDTRFRPESREHELLPTGRLDRRHEVLVVPGVHGGPLDRRLLRKHRADLWPLIPTEALRFDRCEHDRHIEHPGGLCEGDGVVDDRLAIEIRDTEHHLGLVIDECDDAIVRSQQAFFATLRPTDCCGHEILLVVGLRWRRRWDAEQRSCPRPDDGFPEASCQSLCRCDEIAAFVTSSGVYVWFTSWLALI